MTVTRSMSAFLLFLASFCALPARAAYPVVSSVSVAGSGGGADSAYGLAQDASGNLYVAGSLTRAGGLDIWVAKYSPALVLLSSYTYDKAGFDDEAWAVAVDTAGGGVYAAGHVSSSSTTAGYDIWLAKFDSNLALLSTVTVNGSANGHDEARGLRFHGGSLYAVGRSSVAGGSAHWTARYDANLVLLSSSAFVQHAPFGFDILPVASGNIFVGGSRAPNAATSNDAWIGKYDENLVLLASATIDGSASNNDEFRRLVDDGAGGVFAVGYLNTATAADRFIQRYDADLVRVSSSLANGPGNSNEYLTDARLTSSGTLLVCGDHSEAAGAGGINALIAEYSSGLALLSSTSYRSAAAGEDHAYSMLIGANQDLYAAGWTAEATQDAWLARLSTSAPSAAPAAPTGLAASLVGLGAATLSWGAGGNPAGTVYELERSTGTGFGLRKSTTSLVFVDAALTAASTYYYRVRARNAALDASVYTSTIAVVTLPAPVHPAVASVTPSSGAAGTSVSASVTGSGFDGSTSLALEKRSADQGVWTATGAFTPARFQGALIGLRDGRVLLAGGRLSSTLNGMADTELFDPATGAWTAGPPLQQARNQHAAVLLADGRVLISGGVMGTGIASAEIFDPVLSTWTAAAPMAQFRHGHRLALLPDGRVLAAGGWDGTGPRSSAEIYDPATDAWTAAPAMSVGRFYAAAATLSGGKILIAGGSGVGTAEIYDPAANAWTAAGTMSTTRHLHAIALLPDGRALVSGGWGASGTTNKADVFDPATNAWAETGPMTVARYTHAMVTVNGTPFVIGGENASTAYGSTELYDASANAWRPGPSLTGTRTWPQVVALDDGRVLAAGGLSSIGGANLNTAEVLVMPSSQIAATGVSVTDAQNMSGIFDLAGAATGYWDAVARDAGGRAGRLSGGFLAVSTPAAPSGFAGAALSASSILWSWTDASDDESGFRVLSGTASVSGDLAAGTTVWLQSGLGANTLSGPLFIQAFNLAGTVDSSTASRATLAAVPGGLAASGVSPTSGTVSWSDGGNPAGTIFRLERSTGTGYGLRLSSAATSFFDADLAPAATHFYRVLAVNGDSVATAYSSTLAVIASPLPGAPGASGTPAGTALGVSSAAWTWSLSPGASSYNLFRSSDASFLGSSSGASFVETSLTPNTPYGLRVAGVNIAAMGPLSTAATVYTLAADPAGTGTAVTSTTIVVSWGLNGNPASTVAQLDRSTDSVAYSTVSIAAVTAYADADLLGCTTYYYRVRNFNGDALPTGYASFQGLTANTIPSPPAGLTASANAGGTVSLLWGLSPTEGVTGYRLYWDAGAGAVSYAAPIAVLGSTATAFTTGVLTSSASYTFALRAAHRCGVVETTGASAMSGAAVALPAVRAAIKEPDSGRRINGNRVTILGELISGTPSDAQQVLFQYKLAASSAWVDVPAANINHSNPDLAFPYFVHWDVTALPAGSYDLRAVAYDLAGVPDASPPAVRVAVDPVTPDISETLTVEGKIKKEQTVSNAVVSVVETAGAGAGDPAVRVTIPPGAVNTTTATLSVIANPTITTAAPAGQTMVGSAIKIGLSNGQTALAGTAAIVMTYPDTVRFPSLLQIYYLDEATGAWSRDFTTTVDAASRTVTGNTPHFSTFVLMVGTAFSPNLDSVQVYPVPYKPNGTNPDEGRPFTRGDANSGIIFANLASASEIKIYTLTGRLVSSLDSPSIAGTVRWDARNQDGRDVASGAYFAVITAPGQKSVVKKLVIIR
ncbi:MAG: kelch repeat-containing protein [Elusimicrobiota bacterium]|nr:kelch repeat-containing protein [Elusimicrobiota bacterium]